MVAGGPEKEKQSRLPARPDNWGPPSRRFVLDRMILPFPLSLLWIASVFSSQLLTLCSNTAWNLTHSFKDAMLALVSFPFL